MNSYSFFVPGIAAPAGSKNAFPIQRKDGSLGVAVSPASKKSKPWMSSVAEAAKQHIATPIDRGVPIRLILTFGMTRPKAHFNSKGDVKPNAPFYCDKRPDVTKLARCVEDAMKGIAWYDDSQIVDCTHTKHYSSTPGVFVNIQILNANAEQSVVTIFDVVNQTVDELPTITDAMTLSAT